MRRRTGEALHRGRVVSLFFDIVPFGENARDEGGSPKGWMPPLPSPLLQLPLEEREVERRVSANLKRIFT
jgi:hypothetical protein